MGVCVSAGAKDGHNIGEAPQDNQRALAPAASQGKKQVAQSAAAPAAQPAKKASPAATAAAPAKQPGKKAVAAKPADDDDGLPDCYKGMTMEEIEAQQEAAAKQIAASYQEANDAFKHEQEELTRLGVEAKKRAEAEAAERRVVRDKLIRRRRELKAIREQGFTNKASARFSIADGTAGDYFSEHNPQFLLLVTAKGEVRIKGQRTLDRAEDGKGGNDTSFAFIIIRCDTTDWKAAKLFHGHPAKPSHTHTSWLASDEAIDWKKGDIEPGLHYLIAMNMKAGIEGRIDFEVSGPATIKSHPNTSVKLKHTLPLSGDGAAGYGKTQNPQFFFYLSATAEVNLTLRFAGSVKTAVRFFCMKALTGDDEHMTSADEAPGRTTTFPTADGSPGVEMSAYMSANSVSKVVTLDKGWHRILACTQKKGEEGTMTLEADVEDEEADLFGDVQRTVHFEPRDFDELVDKYPFHDCTVSSVTSKVYIDPAAGYHLVQEINAACARINVDRDGSKEKPYVTFRDKHFPPTMRSLNDPKSKGKTLEKVDWLKPPQFCDLPMIFKGGVDANDLRQGFLGNCWFISSLGAISVRPSIFEKAIHPGGEGHAYFPRGGCFLVRIFVSSIQQWRAVIVDDYIAFRNGSNALAHGTDREELWMSLLEKAFAKMAGAYNQLIGSTGVFGTRDALECFTGGKSMGKYTSSISKSEHIAKIATYTKNKWPVVASTTANPHGGNVKGENGLVYNHGYSVLDTVTCGVITLVRLRNPWGYFEWNGAWSDGDALWDQHPDVAAAAGVSADVSLDDGSFWMSFDDFREYFQFSTFCELGYV